MSRPPARRPVSEAEVVRASGPRPTPRQLADELAVLVAALPRFATAPLLRRRHTRWGATAAECAAGMAGDELVSGCQFVCTRAITIGAPPEAAWPWLVQVGFGKAGFYSIDLLDNASHPSATRIIDWSQPTAALLAVILMECGDFSMMREMLRGIQRRAEFGATRTG